MSPGIWALILIAHALHLPFDRARTLYQAHRLEAWVKELPPAVTAVVLDLKTLEGRVGVPFDHPLALKTGAFQPSWDLRPVVQYLHRQGLRVIARVAVLRDSLLYQVVPSPYVRWFTPRNPTALAYNQAILRAVAALPVQEIQLDYLRWPDTRKPKTKAQRRWRRKTLVAFVQRLLEEIPDSVAVSVDLFGRTCFLNPEEADVIGQHPLDFLNLVDFLCPMMYPSHYWGALKDPYQAVYQSTLGLLSLGVPSSRIRPWLQAFPMRLLDTVNLGAYLRRQLEGLQDLGLQDAMFWLPDERVVYEVLQALQEAEGPMVSETLRLGEPEVYDLQPVFADTSGWGTWPGGLSWRRQGSGLAVYWHGMLCRAMHLPSGTFQMGRVRNARKTWDFLWTREVRGTRTVVVLQALQWPKGTAAAARRLPTLVVPDSFPRRVLIRHQTGVSFP